jgi:general transcription factor IIIA
MKGFENEKDLKTHVKKDHVSPFQCEQPDCDRKGNNGWMRKRDMLKHMKKAHGISK